MTSDTWLGDLAIAFAALRPGTESERVTIAALLGLGPAPAVPPQPSVQAPSGHVALPAAEHPSHRPSPASRQQPSRAAEEDEATTATDEPDHASLLIPVGQAQAIDPPEEWISLPRPDPALFGAQPPHEPLLPIRSVASIIQLLLARTMPDGALDVRATVDLLANRHAVRRLPRHPQRTMRYGAQLLVDRSDSMRPFTRDQNLVVQQARRLMGVNSVEVKYFLGSPLRGVAPRPGAGRKRYRVMAPGTRILVLSDFGAINHPNCAPGASRGEWLRFMAVVAHAGGEVVGLIPYPPPRWPRWLQERVNLVTWDRTSTTSTVSTRLR
jgi:hypothetical protein